MTEQEQRTELLVYKIKDNCYEVAKKLLEEHDKQIRADAIGEIIPKVIDLLINANVVSEKNRITDTNWLMEQLKEQK